MKLLKVERLIISLAKHVCIGVLLKSFVFRYVKEFLEMENLIFIINLFEVFLFFFWQLYSICLKCLLFGAKLSFLEILHLFLKYKYRILIDLIIQYSSNHHVYRLQGWVNMYATFNLIFWLLTERPTLLSVDSCQNLYKNRHLVCV